MNDKFTEKWEKTGLLKGLPEDKKVIVSKLLENAAEYIREHIDEKIIKCIFPAIRRLATDDLYVEDIIGFTKSYNTFLIEKEEWIDKIKYVNALDKEVEILTGFCEHYLVESGHYKNHKERINVEKKRWSNK